MKAFAIRGLFGLDHMFEALTIGPLRSRRFTDFALRFPLHKVLAQVRRPCERQRERCEQ